MNMLKHLKTLILQSLLGLSMISGAQAATTTTTYYHTDALGSVVAASDEAGAVLWRKTYDPYGNEITVNQNGDELEEQTYTGKPYDPETGLLYLNQRYYDPQIRRFMGMDPVGFTPSNPASFNRYTYANNNPYKFIDPDGRYGEIAFEAASLAVGANSFITNFQAGDFSSAGIDAAGFVLDAIGAVIPVVPGVVGLGIKAGRESAEAAAKGGPTILRSVGAAVNTGMTFTRRQLQKKFASHGDDFGVLGNANNQTLAQFESAILRHTGSESTLVIQGTYRGTQQVTHFFNPNTGLNVIRDADGAFLSGWKLGRAQIENIMRSGNLQ